MDTTLNIVDTVKAIVEREMRSQEPYESPRIDAAIDAEISKLLGPGFGGILERHYRDYVIQNGMGSRLRMLADDLTQIRTWNIAAAPEPVALVPTSDGHVLISRYWACPGEQAVGYDKTRPLSAEARERFRHDMHVLDQHDKLHPYAGRGYAAWLVGPTSGTIVLSNWTALRALLRGERGELLEHLDELLANAGAAS